MEIETNNYNNETLPEEILTGIFSFLPPKDLGTVAEVCRAWERASSDNVIWKNHCNEEIKKLEGVSFKEKFKEANDPIQVIIQNKDAEIRLGVDGARKIFSPELINSLENPQIERNEKLKLINKYFDTEVAGPFSKPLLSAIIPSLDYWPRGSNNFLGFEIMLKTGANPNIFDVRNHYTPLPLMVAAYFEHEEAIKLLLEYGADPSLTNSEEKTAVDIAGDYFRYDDPERLERIKELLRNHQLNKK